MSRLIFGPQEDLEWKDKGKDKISVICMSITLFMVVLTIVKVELVEGQALHQVAECLGLEGRHGGGAQLPGFGSA